MSLKFIEEFTKWGGPPGSRPTSPSASVPSVSDGAKKENRTLIELIRETLRSYQYQCQLRELNVYGRAKATELGITADDVARLTRAARKELGARGKIKQAAQ